MYDYAYQEEEIPQALVAIKLNDNDKLLYVDSRATSCMFNEGRLCAIKHICHA